MTIIMSGHTAQPKQTQQQRIESRKNIMEPTKAKKNHNQPSKKQVKLQIKFIFF
jgi:hypothetical protein